MAGALAALAMPPLYWLPLAVVGIVVFVWLWETRRRPRIAALRGWAWGIGHFAVGSYWILEAFFVPPADFELLGPPIVARPGGGPGLLPGRRRRAATLGSCCAGRRWRAAIAGSSCWRSPGPSTEWLRGHVFTGYPWNPLGHVWAFATPLLQGAALFGVYGLGTFTFLDPCGARGRLACVASPRWSSVGLAGAAGQAGDAAGRATAAGADGAHRAAQHPAGGEVAARRPRARTAEADRPQPARRLRSARRRHLAGDGARPSSSSPDPPACAMLATAVPPGGYLLTGAARSGDRVKDGVWNSLLAIDRPARSWRDLRQGPSRAARRVHPVPQGTGLRSPA